MKAKGKTKSNEEVQEEEEKKKRRAEDTDLCARERKANKSERSETEKKM